MAYEGDNEAKREFLAKMGAELRAIRLKTDNGDGPLTLEAVADVLVPGKGNRDRISKVERGTSGIDLFDYLRLLWFYREVIPDHPGVALARRLLPKPARDNTGVGDN
jgi:hypothetical protein